MRYAYDYYLNAAVWLAAWLAFTVTAVCLTMPLPPTVASTEARSDLDAAEPISPLA